MNIKDREFKKRLNAIKVETSVVELMHDSGAINDTQYYNELDFMANKIISLMKEYDTRSNLVNTPKIGHFYNTVKL